MLQLLIFRFNRTPMKLNFSLTGVLVLTLCAIARVQSQTVLDLPYASQPAQVKQRVGVTDITITYHRPLVNGRKIWADWYRWVRYGGPEPTRIPRSNLARRFQSKATRFRLVLTACT